ncbi:hypothetical protein Atai01_39310 [Amycolatopsis taiwanensis]|uniref:HTH merR-type domain-containing protein n=2 Tax=Amycolatopsis taiwanensis TaxID=342230 RepID=A0A9W6VHC2_9PSEU|nr:hypothetical protein Atai01_39310 [Amycolatopsis taiwanensis]
MPIGAFAQRSGLTASALRFYADSGLLAPAEVDAFSGYRFYAVGQVERAVLLRRLREIGMPLATVQAVLDAEPGEAVRLVEEHVKKVASDAATAQQHAAAIKASLADEPRLTVATLSGPVLAAAIEQILTATTYEPGMTVLNGVRFESGPEAVVLTATDRYRLSTRTLVSALWGLRPHTPDWGQAPRPPSTPAPVAWAATVDADDLRACLPDLRRSPEVTITAARHAVQMRLQNREDCHCRLLSEPFPDYRLVLDGLSTVSTRVTVEKTLLLRAIEAISSPRISMVVRSGRIIVTGTVDTRDSGGPVPASVTGLDADIWFEVTTLYPAISTAIGADLLLDFRGPDQPATVRSADHGDLTTLAMPIQPELSEASPETQRR